MGGSKQDVRIFRNGARQMILDTNTVATGDVHVLGQLKVNGDDLQTVCFICFNICPTEGI